MNTGVFDDLVAIADAVEGTGAWLHVDGAFGLWAAASPSLSHLVAGSERADSWATDAHKWLNVPYDCGIAFCAHPDAHREAMTAQAVYLVREADVDPGAGRLDARALAPCARGPGLRGPASARPSGVAELVERRAPTRDASPRGSRSCRAARCSTTSCSTRCSSASPTMRRPRRRSPRCRRAARRG